MPQILQLAQLVQDDGMTEVNVGRGRIQAELAAKWLTACMRARKLLGKLGLDQQFVATAPDQRKGLLDFPSNRVGFCGRWIHRSKGFLPSINQGPTGYNSAFVKKRTQVRFFLMTSC